MRGIAGAVFALLFLLASRAAVRADEAKPPPTPDAAAAEVAKAWKEKDAALLATLAARETPDPWLVADAMLLLGERDAAAAFATAAPRKDVEELTDFVATWSNGEADKAAREVIAKINAGISGGRPAESLAAPAAPDGAMPYLRARIAFGRALALARLGKHVEAADQHRAAANAFEDIGWLARAAMAAAFSVDSERAANRVAQAREGAERLLALETKRGGRAGIGMALYLLGSVHGDAGRLEDANAAFERALEAFRETGDRRRQATVLQSVAWFEMHHGSMGKAERALKNALAITEPAELWAETAESHRLMGVAQRGVGMMSVSVGSYRKALEAALKAKDDGTVARLHFDIGRGLGDVGEHELALAPLQASVTAYEGLRPAGEWWAHLARARRAWSLAALGRTPEARPEVERVLEATKGSPNPWLVGTVLQANARLLRAEGKLPEAVKAYEAAHPRLLESGEGTQGWLAMLELAETHREAKDLPQARTVVETTIAEAKKQHGEFLQFHAEALAARIRDDQGEKEEALRLARSAREGFRSLHEERALKEIEAWISEREAAAPR